MCYDLAHQIRCAKHTFSGRYDITPMVCCSFGGHSTPHFLQCNMHTQGIQLSIFQSFLESSATVLEYAGRALPVRKDTSFCGHSSDETSAVTTFPRTKVGNLEVDNCRPT